jgi:hypothetical protein
MAADLSLIPGERRTVAESFFRGKDPRPDKRRKLPGFTTRHFIEALDGK